MNNAEPIPKSLELLDIQANIDIFRAINVSITRIIYSHLQVSLGMYRGRRK